MTRVRFDLDLTEEDLKGLDTATKRFHRNRKNLCEAIILICIEEFKKYEGTGVIQISQLGDIKEPK